PFQISALEFSPSLEIASVILNSNSKQVIVQLPGAGASPAEGAPMFEIANLELTEHGEIAMVQLNLLGGPKRAEQAQDSARQVVAALAAARARLVRPPPPESCRFGKPPPPPHDLRLMRRRARG